MQKKELALQVIERLKKEYPDTGCSLDYDDAWKLLVSVRLAAQCTDARVNVVVQDLYREFPDVDALADADVEEIERIVKPCGLGHSKARDISACMKMLKEKYQGKVPEDFDALLELPGVGQKECQSGDGGRLWTAGDRHRYALYPPGEPHWACGRDQGTKESGDGTLEADSAGGEQ